MIAYFKLINARSYSFRSPKSGRYYDIKLGEMFGVSDENDIPMFRNQKTTFQEVDNNGNEILLAGIRPPVGTTPISYSVYKPKYTNPGVEPLSGLKHILHPSSYKQFEDRAAAQEAAQKAEIVKEKNIEEELHDVQIGVEDVQEKKKRPTANKKTKEKKEPATKNTKKTKNVKKVLEAVSTELEGSVLETNKED